MAAHGVVPYKILSCSAENSSHPSRGIYESFSEDGSYYETPKNTTKVEIVIGLSSLTSIRTVVLGLSLA